MNLQDRLYELRKNRRLTQEETAQGMEIALRSYRRYESGEREPVASVLEKMEDYYGVSLDYLVGRAE